ncbi:hypothetical protein vseg_013225 [Gypsophila vaccaria]
MKNIRPRTPTNPRQPLIFLATCYTGSLYGSSIAARQYSCPPVPKSSITGHKQQHSTSVLTFFRSSGRLSGNPCRSYLLSLLSLSLPPCFLILSPNFVEEHF